MLIARKARGLLVRRGTENPGAGSEERYPPMAGTPPWNSALTVGRHPLIVRSSPLAVARSALTVDRRPLIVASSPLTVATRALTDRARRRGSVLRSSEDRRMLTVSLPGVRVPGVEPRTARILVEPGVKPRDDELDLFGLTHAGKVRRENQDHFLLCTVHPVAVVHATSLPDPQALPLRGERLATVMLVADGVGGATEGGEASRLAVQTITRYVTSTLRCYHAVGAADQPFLDALRAAVLEADAAVRAEAGVKNMATTLTLVIAVWPWMYVVQVGDSRCYFFHDGRLDLVTRDQTVAQDLVDRGALPPERVAASPFVNVFASAIGGPGAAPVWSRPDPTGRGGSRAGWTTGGG